MGIKRSSSDPASWLPKHTFPGTIDPKPYSIVGPRFDMPSIQTELEVSRVHPHLYGSASEQSAVEHSLRAGPEEPALLGVI